MTGTPITRETTPFDNSGVSPNPQLERLHRRGAFISVMFPDYFGVNEAVFDDVTPEAYEVSSPEALNSALYQKTSQSMRQTEKGIWVVLDATEYSTVISIPAPYADKAEARHRARCAVLYSDHDRGNAAAIRAGAHALETWVEPMTNLTEGYNTTIEDMRELKEMIWRYWIAQKSGIELRRISSVARDGLHNALTALSQANKWTGNDLRLARAGLDKRLLAGKGQERLNDKKENWERLRKVFGNYVIIKKILVNAKLDNLQTEIKDRLTAGSVE